MKWQTYFSLIIIYLLTTNKDFSVRDHNQQIQIKAGTYFSTKMYNIKYIKQIIHTCTYNENNELLYYKYDFEIFFLILLLILRRSVEVAMGFHT